MATPAVFGPAKSGEYRMFWRIWIERPKQQISTSQATACTPYAVTCEDIGALRYPATGGSCFASRMEMRSMLCGNEMERGLGEPMAGVEAFERAGRSR
jgi:hypothetical protein